MANHTEGPWFVGEDDRNGQAVVRNKHIEVATLWHHCVGAIEKEMRANAHLVAAAPELLGALRFILAFYEPDANRYLDTEAWKNAEASARYAVAKAEGRK